MVTTNIKIQTSYGSRLDYTSPEDLNIKFNRIADDATKPDARFGEFSYSFKLPKTKKNARILGFANAKSIQKRFSINPIDISVFNNDALVLEGTLEVETITRDSYECRFYSKLTQLVDVLEDINLQDINTMPIIDSWDEETTIRTHINAGYKNSDETSYQFPLVFYNTYFTPYSTYEGLTDFDGATFRDEGDRPQQNFYYMLNRTQTGSDNEWYHHQLPLSFYIKSVMEGVLEYVGWSLSGSFWETDEAKQIIMLYTGENDIYDAARLWKNNTTGEYIATTANTAPAGYTVAMNTNKFLPDMDALDYISGIINMFNLYVTLDINNKIITFETYDNIFGHKIEPYNLDKKIDAETIDIDRYEDYDFSITFQDPQNKNHLGDNYFYGRDSTNALTKANYLKTSNGKYDDTYNHIGQTKGEISVPFAAPKVKRMYIRNTDNYAGTITSANDHVIFMPDMSQQTRFDNNNVKFNGGTGQTTVFNEEDSVKFKGKATLMYYYGISESEFVQAAGKGACSDYFYVDFDNTKQKIGIASPFAWKSYRNPINTQLELADTGSTASMYASYLQTVYLNMGTGWTDNNRYSLIFGDSHGLAETLYTKFYRNRMNRYRDSEVLSATVRLNPVDWNTLQFNQPVIYDNEIYSIMEIKDYDIVKGVAKIKLLKQL